MKLCAASHALPARGGGQVPRYGQCQLDAGVALSFWSAAGWSSSPETAQGTSPTTPRARASSW